MTEFENTSFNPSKIYNWQCSTSSNSEVLFAKEFGELIKIIDLTKASGKNLSFRGAGCSYSDVFLNEGNIIADLSGMNKIKSWDPVKKEMVVEPGVTFEQVLLKCLPDNCIIGAIPGTRYPTIGGAIANNIHGKNSYKLGNFGDSVFSLKILTSSKEVIKCSRTDNPELFRGVIGGLGLLGIVIEATLKLTPVPSPVLEVSRFTVPNMYAMIERLELEKEGNDYIIGQVDTFARNHQTGRGTIHTAVFSKSAAPGQVSKLGHEIPEKMFNVLPKRWMVSLGKKLMGAQMMKLVSTSKYIFDSFSKDNAPFQQSFFPFNFLLDQVPDWKSVFRHGFYEHESLLPTAKAARVFNEIIQLTHNRGIPAFLAAVKAHRGDDYLLSFAMEGYSIGIDVPIIPKKEKQVEELIIEMNELARQNGGIVYFAKDQLLSNYQTSEMYKGCGRFMELKKKYDRHELFQSNSYRRLFRHGYGSDETEHLQT